MWPFAPPMCNCRKASEKQKEAVRAQWRIDDPYYQNISTFILPYITKECCEGYDVSKTDKEWYTLVDTERFKRETREYYSDWTCNWWHCWHANGNKPPGTRNATGHLQARDAPEDGFIASLQPMLVSSFEEAGSVGQSQAIDDPAIDFSAVNNAKAKNYSSPKMNIAKKHMAMPILETTNDPTIADIRSLFPRAEAPSPEPSISVVVAQEQALVCSQTWGLRETGIFFIGVGSTIAFFFVIACIAGACSDARKKTELITDARLEEGRIYEVRAPTKEEAEKQKEEADEAKEAEAETAEQVAETRQGMQDETKEDGAGNGSQDIKVTGSATNAEEPEKPWFMQPSSV